MSRPAIDASRLTPELLVRAYAAGVFPMAKSANDPTIYWIDPKTRGILPLDAVHVPRRLKRTVRAGPFDVVCDRDFDDVVRLCAEGTARRRDTWINPEIRRAYGELHALGLAHSVECWQGDALVGGLYGVALKGVFFGESMFSRLRDASKVALIHLAARLKAGGFRLLDTQFVTEHLMQFGAVEIPARRYLERLEAALEVDAAFYPGEGAVSASLAELLQSSTQTS